MRRHAMYKIMHKDDVIALADENCITEIINRSLCPHCFVVGMPLYIWLDNRCVDVHRSHSRKLFKALRLKNSDDMSQIISIGHGISITDNWWIQKSDESLDYESLKKYNEEIADIALYGSSDSESGNTKGYLELGTVGSYEKAWRFENGGWFMYKQGNIQELVSEYYSYAFLEKLNFDVAYYYVKQTISFDTGLTSTYILSRDFTNNAEVDFEPFCNYYADNEEPDYIIPKLPDNLIVPYVMTVFYDVLLYNGDRHNQNIGVLRNSTTGEIIGLAPGFDYNLGLISQGTPRINNETGNILANAFLANEVCRKVLKEEIPDRNAVINAIEYASEKVKQNLDVKELKFSVIEDYIITCYDYIVSKL